MRGEETPEQDTGMCLLCGSHIPLNSTRCPHCGIDLDPGYIEQVIEILQSPDEEEAEVLQEPTNLMRDRILFYAGLILIMVGGPGLSLGSWLHDLFGVPIGGEVYEAFGWLNLLIAFIGFGILIAGIILLVISLKGGVISEDIYKKLSTEGQDA